MSLDLMMVIYSLFLKFSNGFSFFHLSYEILHKKFTSFFNLKKAKVLRHFLVRIEVLSLSRIALTIVFLILLSSLPNQTNFFLFETNF